MCSADDAGHPPLPDRKRPAHFRGIEQKNRATIFFVTVCTKDRRPLLATPEMHVLLREAWETANHFQVGRYVIMPDHVHLFCSPGVWPPQPLPRWVSYWKSIVARRCPEAEGAKLWQRDFWDTQLRPGETYSEKWDYVRRNPVRAGLAPAPEAWSYCGEIHPLRWHD